MAVKVMVAPAIAKGDLDGARNALAPAVPHKPRRRRSSVYDADGNEVFITLICLKCHKMRPLSQFGLRKMADGAIRNQPWCRSCRSTATERPRRRGTTAAADRLKSADKAAAAEVSRASEKPVSAAQVAAQVAAALAGGRSR